MSATQAGPDWAARYAGMCGGEAIGLVHDHATHHVSVETSLGRIYGREDWAAALARDAAGLKAGPGARVTAWTGASRGTPAVVVELDLPVAHDGDSPLYGPATGRQAIVARTLVGLVHDDRIYRAWQVVDHASAMRELGADIGARARDLAATAPGRGGIPWEFGEVRAALGQVAPPEVADPPPGLEGAAADVCARWVAAWNQRRLDRLATIYEPDATVIDGARTIDEGVSRHPWRRVLDACPTAVLFLERAVASGAAPGDDRLALLWRWIGPQTGTALGPPCGRRLHVRGLSVLHLRSGRIARERVVLDELGVRRDAALRAPAAETRS